MPKRFLSDRSTDSYSRAYHTLEGCSLEQLIDISEKGILHPEDLTQSELQIIESFMLVDADKLLDD